MIILMVVPGPASPMLGRKVAELANAKVVPLLFKSFPDGESYVRFDGDVNGEEVVVVQTTGPPQDTRLIQLLLIIDAARDLGARKVVAVAPYLAYARQDQRFLLGEAFSIKTIIKLFEVCDVDKIITVNFHNPKILSAFNVPVENLSAIGLLAEHLKKRGLEGAFSLTLGKMAPEVAEQATNVLKGGYACIPTQRNYQTGEVNMERPPLPVEGKDVIIFDDIISSCGTASEAAKMVRDQGASSVYAACVHPLLAGDAVEMLLKSGVDEIVGTDCVPSPVSVVSVAPLIAQALKPR